MIKIDNVSITFGKGTPLQLQALKHINLDIHPGDFITVIGTNGAGKSTLLKMLAGDISSDKGEIYYLGKKITRTGVETRSNWISHVYQDPRIGTCESLTIEENMAFALRRGQKRGLKPAINAKKKADFKILLADLNLGLEDRLHDPVILLSGGQRQALSLIMATLCPPALLLLDEHTAALDPKTAQTILAISKRLVMEHQLTAFMVTHQLHHALEMGNRTLIMQEGAILRNISEDEKNTLKPGDLLNHF